MEPSPPVNRRRKRRLLVALTLLAAAYGGWYGFWRYHLKRFATVRPGVLYRVGQPSKLGLKHLAHWYGVRTIVSAQTFDTPLCKGLYDPGKPSGPRETEVAGQLGLNHVQWPMGAEANWPFPTPWQFEAFFQLMDDPTNYPVVLHCAGGKHRTGSLAALYRLEYDRWSIEKTLAEMYAFDFGGQQPTQELNLRTYVRRPQPSDDQWQHLSQTFLTGEETTDRLDYSGLIRLLNDRRAESSIENRLAAYFKDREPFAVCLAQRIVRTVDEPLALQATALAAGTLADPTAPADDWSMAAATVADLGSPAQQAKLQKLLGDEINEGPVTPRYQALVRGVTNRYTPNRRAWLKPILSDERLCAEPEAAGRRYCDVAMVRLAVIENIGFPWDKSDPKNLVFSWDLGVQAARAWFDQNRDAQQLVQLQPPTGQNEVTLDAVPLPKNIQRQAR